MTTAHLADSQKNWPHYVYRLFDSDGVLLYVGCSDSPEWRIRNYHAQPFARTGQSRHAWELYQRYDHHSISDPYPTRLEARAAERAAIFAEQPLFNVHHKTRAPT